MRSRFVLLVLLLLAACEGTAPILNPVNYDASLTFQTLRFDFDTKTYPMNQTFTGTFMIDFGSTGAQFDLSGSPPCMYSRGKAEVKNNVVTGTFHGQDYSPMISLSGSVDSVGVMSGSFECFSAYGGSPHHDTYTGTFRLTPRR